MDMDLLNNFGNLLKTTLNNCYKDKKLRKYLLAGIILQIISISIMLIWGFIITSSTLQVATPDQLMPAMSNLLFSFITFFAILFFILLVYLIITYLTINRSLEITKRKTIPLGIINFIKFCIMYLFYFVAVTFSLFNLKFLLILIAGLIFFTIGVILLLTDAIIGGILILFSLIFFLAYYIVIIYNSFRLYFIEPIFLETGEMVNTLKKCWKLTKEKVADLFIVIILIIIIYMTLYFVLDLPSMIYSFLVGFGTAISTIGSQQTNISLSTDPIYLLLQLPTAILMGVYLVFINNFLVVIYDFISKKQKTKK